MLQRTWDISNGQEVAEKVNAFPPVCFNNCIDHEEKMICKEKKATEN